MDGWKARGGCAGLWGAQSLREIALTHKECWLLGPGLGLPGRVWPRGRTSLGLGCASLHGDALLGILLDPFPGCTTENPRSSESQSWLRAWLCRSSRPCHPIAAHPRPGMPSQPCCLGSLACSGCADILREPGGGRAACVGVSTSRIPAQHPPGSRGAARRAGAHGKAVHWLYQRGLWRAW